MRYFGWLPAGELRTRLMPTPVGAVCGWCTERIEDGDRGVEMLLIGALGNGLEITVVYFHRECELRQIFGSVGHQKGLCGCGTARCGDGETDPPGMSVRDAARAACAYFDEHRT